MEKYCIITNEGKEIFNSNNFSLRPGDSVIVPYELGDQLLGDFDFLVMEDTSAAKFLTELGYLPFQAFFRFVDEEPPAPEDGPTWVPDETVEKDGDTLLRDYDNLKIEEMLSNVMLEEVRNEDGTANPRGVLRYSRTHFDFFMSKEAMLNKRDKKKYKLSLVELAEKILQDREKDNTSKAAMGREEELAFRLHCEWLEHPTGWGMASKYFEGRANPDLFKKDKKED